VNLSGYVFRCLAMPRLVIDLNNRSSLHHLHFLRGCGECSMSRPMFEDAVQYAGIGMGSSCPKASCLTPGYVHLYQCVMLSNLCKTPAPCFKRESEKHQDSLHLVLFCVSIGIEPQYSNSLKCPWLYISISLYLLCNNGFPSTEPSSSSSDSSSSGVCKVVSVSEPVCSGFSLESR
jgi:hypothetical protein